MPFDKFSNVDGEAVAASSARQPSAVVERLAVGESTTVYRGSVATPERQYAGFPSLVRFDDQHLGCAFTMGRGMDQDNSRAVFARSRDAGATWVLEGPIRSPASTHADIHPTNDIRISLASSGRLVGFGALL